VGAVAALPYSRSKTFKKGRKIWIAKSKQFYVRAVDAKNGI
jgi:hypothetical protein